MNIKLVLLTLVVAAVGTLIGCESGSISGSKIELVGQESESNIPFFGEDSVVVKCRFLNKGNATTITAKAEVNGPNGSWTKRQTTNIARDDEREIVFDFPEADFSLLGDNSYTYGCGWEK